MEIKFNIFISHDSSDETIAIELKSFLENIFLNSNVYVSGRDLQGGQIWIENIKFGLKTSQVIISLITNKSIENKWIYFETGAGFIEDKSIPLLSSEIKFSDLKPPLSLLQSRTLSKTGIEALVKDISSKLNLRTPNTLNGLEKLLEETDKFLKIRQEESPQPQLLLQETPIGVTTTTNKKIVFAKKVENEVDEEIEKFYKRTKKRAVDLIRRKIITYKNTLDVPSEEEINELSFSELYDVAQAYNIPVPNSIRLNLMLAAMVPKKDAKRWEKINAMKNLEDTDKELDKYEKTI